MFPPLAKIVIISLQKNTNIYNEHKINVNTWRSKITITTITTTTTTTCVLLKLSHSALFVSLIFDSDHNNNNIWRRLH